MIKTRTPVRLWPPDVPGPVGLPFAGENLTNDSCKLTWYTPEDDGGSAITNYIIEKRESDRMGWTSVTYTVTRNNAVVQGLLDGKGYFFRIAAENIIGMGPFVETDRVVLIKEPICKIVWQGASGRQKRDRKPVKKFFLTGDAPQDTFDS